MTGRDPGRFAEGATGAPATVFVYPVACRLDGRHYRCDSPRAPRPYSRNIKGFNDYINVLHDLFKDAGSCGCSVTLPGSALAGNGLGRASLADAVARGER